MIPVTIMIWFELNGEPRYRDLETRLYAFDVQETAEFYASSQVKGRCKIFDNRSNLEIGSAGFE
ncbi:hypothetical protein [Escherichia phage CLB_P2]|nr:hypothetical protein dhaeg_265 [Escherichia phage dhaeg]QHR72399.1 hypothetical protein dhabil_56 [Escherichia phage dhabil]UNI73187.1 hypothetical protein [Escherichia phage CLB_P2]